MNTYRVTILVEKSFLLKKESIKEAEKLIRDRILADQILKSIEKEHHAPS